MKDHIYNAMRDLGAIGEQKVEVFYDWSEPRKSNDPFEVPDNGGAIVVAVLVFLDGKEVNLYDYLNDNMIQDLEYECAENFRR